MGLFKDLFFKKEDKTGAEKQIEEQIRKNPEQYTPAQVENIPRCNGCSQDIEGKPRLIKNNGKILYFHKRCIRAMSRGQLPTPKLVNDLDGEQKNE